MSKFFRYSGVLLLSLSAIALLLIIDLRYPLTAFLSGILEFTRFSDRLRYRPYIAPALVALLFFHLYAIASLSFMRGKSWIRKNLILLPVFALVMTPYLWVQAHWDVAKNPALLFEREGHCQSPLVSSLSPTLAPKLPLKARYYLFWYGDVCRAIQFHEVFFKNRSALCSKPGITEEVECLKDWTRKLSEKAPFTTPGQLMMLSDGVMLMMEKKKAGLALPYSVWHMAQLTYINIEAGSRSYRFSEISKSPSADIDLWEEVTTRAFQLALGSRFENIFKNAKDPEMGPLEAGVRQIVEYWQEKDPDLKKRWTEGLVRNPALFEGGDPFVKEK